MRRSKVPTGLLRRLCNIGTPAPLAGARLLGSTAGLGSHVTSTTSAAASLRLSLWGRRWFRSAEGGGSSGGSDKEQQQQQQGGSGENSSSAAWEAVNSLSAEATELAEGGNEEAAKQMLKEALPGLVERFGAEDPAVGLIYNQLALWQFYDGDYEAAVEVATAAHKVWVKEMGEDSQAAAFHGIRLGMTLAAAGKVEEAFPLLEKGLAVAIDNYNHHVKQLEGLMPLAEDSSAAAEKASPADQAAMAARAEQQRVSVAMLHNLGRALQEAKFYRALSFTGCAGREMDSKWDEKGAGAVFFLEQEMSDAITDMLRWAPPGHPTITSALREHRRLVEQCEKEGLRRLHDDLQIHHQRLRDVVADAAEAAQGGPTGGGKGGG